jgi:hypothetical protein
VIAPAPAVLQGLLLMSFAYNPGSDNKLFMGPILLVMWVITTPSCSSMISRKSRVFSHLIGSSTVGDSENQRRKNLESAAEIHTGTWQPTQTRVGTDRLDAVHPVPPIALKHNEFRASYASETRGTAAL